MSVLKQKQSVRISNPQWADRRFILGALALMLHSEILRTCNLIWSTCENRANNVSHTARQIHARPRYVHDAMALDKILLNQKKMSCLKVAAMRDNAEKPIESSFYQNTRRTRKPVLGA